MPKPSICILSHNSYGTLVNTDTGHIGGIEIQTPLMARWLVQNGFDVTFICWDEGQPDGQVVDGITIHKLCRRDQGIPILRFIWPRWSSLVKALERANPDVVYYNLGDLALGQIAMWAKRRGRKVLYSVANEPDCMKSLPKLKKFRERFLYKYGLQRANKIVVQTRKQQELLKSDFSLESVHIPMPCQGFSIIDDLRRRALEREKPHVLWIGRFDYQKRLEALLDLASIETNIVFDVIGSANSDSDYARDLVKRAKSIDNVVLHGRVPHEKIGQFYSSSNLLCCTSRFEGFPNIFLEAWSTGLPVVTTFDPDGTVSRFGLGQYVADPSQLSGAIRAVLSPEKWKQYSAASIQYFETYHKADSVMQSFSALFKELAEPKN